MERGERETEREREREKEREKRERERERERISACLLDQMRSVQRTRRL